jgi:hypothetical protein
MQKDIVSIRKKGNKSLDVLLDTAFQITDPHERLKYLNRIKRDIEVAIDDTKSDLTKEETK